MGWEASTAVSPQRAAQSRAVGSRACSRRWAMRVAVRGRSASGCYMMAKSCSRSLATERVCAASAVLLKRATAACTKPACDLMHLLCASSKAVAEANAVTPLVAACQSGSVDLQSSTACCAAMMLSCWAVSICFPVPSSCAVLPFRCRLNSLNLAAHPATDML